MSEQSVSSEVDNSNDSDDSDTAQLQATTRRLRSLVGTLRRRLREESVPGDLTPSQHSVMARLLSDGPATLTALARAEGMRPQSMGSITSSLEAVGFVTGSPDPTDGRATILSLTSAAHDQINASRIAREDWLFRTIRSTLTPNEEKELIRGVELLARLVGS